MKLQRIVPAMCALAFPLFAFAQQSAPPPSDPTQPQTQAPAQSPGAEQGGGRWAGRGMGPGSGVMGTVTEAASDHFTVKNTAGESWTIRFDDQTRIMKQQPRASGADGAQPGRFGGEAIKASEIKIGDAVMAGGDVDQAGKTVAAKGIFLLDPARAEQMRQMQANYGKTWLAGRVTAINNTSVTVQGGMDSAPHTFVADENTQFRRRREPITLADVQVGDNVRVEGAVKDGQFVAATVNLMMPPAVGGPVMRPGPPPQ